MTWNYMLVRPLTEGVEAKVSLANPCICRPSAAGGYMTICGACGGAYVMAPTSAAMTIQGGPRG